MSYKIAVASSDGKQVDQTFGAAEKFIIYDVSDGVYVKLEERTFHKGERGSGRDTLLDGESPLEGCSSRNGCSDADSGCGGAGEASEKVNLISDCRCVVCKKIGFHIQKQLERKAISVFDVNCSVEEALEKISCYFSRMDHHKSLRVER